MAERNNRGQFVAGHTGMGGRPSRAQELAYLEIMCEVVKLGDWKSIVGRAKKDALSDAAHERETGRRFLAEYLIGKPARLYFEPEPLPEEDIDPYSEYEKLSDEELRAIIADDKAQKAALAMSQRRKPASVE